MRVFCIGKVWQLIAIFDKETKIRQESFSLSNQGYPDKLKIVSSGKIKCKRKIKLLLEQLTALTGRKKKTATRLTRNSKIIKTIIEAIKDKKGVHIVSLDLRKINEAVADFFIVCEATSQPQVRAIADNVEKMVKEKCGENPYRHEGYSKLQWVLIDYVNVVVHIMQHETRKFYRLEEMWSDAGLTTHDE